jgi:hypothetical protein
MLEQATANAAVQLSLIHGIILAQAFLGASAKTSFVWEPVLQAAPAWRFLASSAVDNAQQRWFLYGGHSQPGRSCDTELWEFKSTTNTWTLLSSGSLDGPGPVGV